MTPAQLLKAVENRQCVTGLASPRHMPAAFLVSMQFRLVMQFMPDLKIYKPKKRKKEKNEQCNENL